LRKLNNKKELFYKLSVRYLVVKPACVNAALFRVSSHLYRRHRIVSRAAFRTGFGFGRYILWSCCIFSARQLYLVTSIFIWRR